MIDIHCHVLPGLDDGPATFDESLAMLDAAAAAGTTDIIATPHASQHYRHDPETAERLITELAAGRQNGPRLHRGCEFLISLENIQDALSNPSRYTLAGGPYLLAEAPDILAPAAAGSVLAELRRAGMVPVIAHPERNPLLRRSRKHLDEWLEAGCLMQITATALTGGFGAATRKFCRELLERDAVHFIASDAHGREDRPPRLDEARQEVARSFGEARAERLFVTNPRAVLAREDLPDAVPEPAAPRRKWYQFGA